jgi:uncharacterized protein
MFRSGAQIAWDYMNQEDGNETVNQRPWFVEMIADRDLWTWKLDWSKFVWRATRDMGYHKTVEKVDEIISSGKSYEDFITIGKGLEDFTEEEIKEYTANVVFCKFKVPSKEYKVGLSSAPYYLRSQVGNSIVETHPVDFAVMYKYNFLKDEYYIACRSRKDVDLSKIINVLPNGGGHAQASGFTIYGPNSKPPENLMKHKGETMHTYLEHIKESV